MHRGTGRCGPRGVNFCSLHASVVYYGMFLVLQGEKDWQKYETARLLHKTVDKIRAQYREDWKSKEMRVRQRSVALYFIDKVSSTFLP